MLQRSPFFWLWLSLQQGLGSRKLAQIYEYFGSHEAVLTASEAELQQLGFTSSQLAAIEQYRHNPASITVLQKTAEWLQHNSLHQIISIESECYPESLKHIADPPVVLFAIGDLELLSFPQLAIIGSRKATAQGLENAYRFSKALSEQGLIPTSGLALGVDAKAHQGGIDGHGLTVAVLGTGIDYIYPKTNARLAGHIIENKGVIISEYPLGTAPIGYNFPRRNRIISGLSLGCLVIEASLRSGSLITARSALEQGREVFAIPGSIHNPASRGCHQLIRQGATLVDEVSQIYETIAPQLQLPEITALPQRNLPLPELSVEEELLLDAMGHDSCTFDYLIDQTTLIPHQLSQLLLGLELKGLVRTGAGAYQRIHE